MPTASPKRRKAPASKTPDAADREEVDTDHKRFNIDVTEAALADYRRAAELTGQSMSEWARIVLRKAAASVLAKAARS